MKPHKHAELIKAWADGAEIEEFNNFRWCDSTFPTWHEHIEYRIKYIIKFDRITFMNNRFGLGWAEDSYPYSNADEILRIFRDAKTDKIKLVEVCK